MHLIYLAGPVRAESPNKTHRNIIKAEKIANKLWKMGFAVICPHKNCEFLEGVVSNEQIMKGSIDIVRRCDALVLLPNWARSEGAKEEREFCINADIPVFYWLGDYHLLHRLADGQYTLAQHLTQQQIEQSRETKLDRVAVAPRDEYLAKLMNEVFLLLEEAGDKRSRVEQMAAIKALFMGGYFYPDK